MTLRTGRRSHFLRRCRERGFPVEVASAAIVGSSDSDLVTVDVDHPDYPAYQPLVSGAELWAEIHSWPLSFDGRVEREMARLRSVPRRLPMGCDCIQHWNDYLDRHPPRLHSRAAYALWTYDAHVAVNLRLGRPGVTRREAIEQHEWAALDI